MPTESIRLEGAKDLQRRLKSLPAKVAGKVTRQALRAGAKIFQAQAASNAPVRKGLLSRSIKVRAAKRSRGRVGIVVQTSQGFFKGATFYGAFQEFGWRVGRRALGATRRLVPGKHFIKSAFDSRKAEALQVVTEQLRAGIEREAKS
jgi:HK97 gp10 family phage protein